MNTFLIILVSWATKWTEKFRYSQICGLKLGPSCKKRRLLSNAMTVPAESPVNNIPLQMAIPLILVECASITPILTPTSRLLFPFSIRQSSTRPLLRPIAISLSLQTILFFSLVFFSFFFHLFFIYLFFF